MTGDQTHYHHHNLLGRCLLDYPVIMVEAVAIHEGLTWQLLPWPCQHSCVSQLDLGLCDSKSYWLLMIAQVYQHSLWMCYLQALPFQIKVQLRATIRLEERRMILQQQHRESIFDVDVSPLLWLWCTFISDCCPELPLWLQHVSGIHLDYIVGTSYVVNFLFCYSLNTNLLVQSNLCVFCEWILAIAQWVTVLWEQKISSHENVCFFFYLQHLFHEITLF